MDSVFNDNKNQSQYKQNIIDHTTPGVYVYNPLCYKGSFVKVSTPVTHQLKKRRSMSTQTVLEIPRGVSDNDILKYFRKTKNIARGETYSKKIPDFNTVLDICDKEDDEFDLYCYDDMDEIFEDINMEKQLVEITSLSMKKPVQVNGSEPQESQEGRLADTYPSFQHWGTDISPFANSISQLY